MIRFLYIFTALIICAGPAFAQENENDIVTVETTIEQRIKDRQDNNFLSLAVENDLFGGGTDEYYTNGVRLTYFDVETPMPPIIDLLADAIPTFDINTTTSTYYTIGQNIYTPDNIETASLLEDDRPYAGWLYGAVGLTSITNNHLDELEFTLGIVGPTALGEQTQKFVHTHVSNSPTPLGWRNQLENEVGAIISARRRWPTWHTNNIGPLRLRVEPDINLSLGNVYTYAGTGATITLGPYEDRLQDTPTRVRPAMPGTGFFDSKDDSFSWFLFAGVDGRAIARNIFLDGNTFRDSHSVDKEYFIADANAGFAITYDDYRLSYTLNYRTKEFEDQDEGALFGSITASMRF
ncbi:MAG: lipid A deacylase LpxR family protein [Pseudomonadota bacterium]